MVAELGCAVLPGLLRVCSLVHGMQCLGVSTLSSAAWILRWQAVTASQECRMALTQPV